MSLYYTGIPSSARYPNSFDTQPYITVLTPISKTHTYEHSQLPLNQIPFLQRLYSPRRYNTIHHALRNTRPHYASHMGPQHDGTAPVRAQPREREAVSCTVQCHVPQTGKDVSSVSSISCSILSLRYGTLRYTLVLFPVLWHSSLRSSVSGRSSVAQSTKAARGALEQLSFHCSPPLSLPR